MSAKQFAAALAGETPDQQRQREFLTALFDGIRDTLIKKVPQMPAEWDGHELRQIAFDHVAQCTSNSLRDKRGRRYRDYEANCLSRNLY